MKTLSSFRSSVKRSLFLLISSILLLPPLASGQDSALAEDAADRIFLTWQQDPLTTMTIMCLHEADSLPSVEGAEKKPVFAGIPNVGEIALDGSAADWWDKGYKVGFVTDDAGQLPEPEDFQAELRIGWNDEGLVVAARIQDNEFNEREELASIWGGDSIELFMADKVGSPRRQQILVRPGMHAEGGKGNAALHLIEFSPSRGPIAEELSAKAVTHVGEGSYTVEILLPWTNLPGLEFGLGAEVALQLHVNDLDKEGRRKHYRWHPGAAAHSDTTSMHALKLEQEAGEPIASQTLLTSDEGNIVEVRATANEAGRKVRVQSGEEILAEEELKAVDGLARASVRLPEPPEGRNWGFVDVLIEDRLISSVQLPLYHQAPKTRTLSYWRADAGETTAQTADMATRPVKFWDGKFMRHTEITGLEPDTAYRFKIGGGTEYGFRTMPADLSKPVRVMFGGDVRHTQEWMEQMNTAAMKHRPQAIIWGGDLAYANGNPENTHLWQQWFDAAHNTLRDEENNFVPIVCGIGNHEVEGGNYTRHAEYEQTDEWREKIAPFYYQFFLFPGQPGYGVLDFGNYLSLLFLDTNHTNPIQGVQTEWLKDTLAARKDVRHLIPVYHVPAWPSVRSFESGISRAVREIWLPLYEEAGVRIAFEHHDHAYKRTPRIRAGKVDESGILYVGDGSWGVAVRDVHPAEITWYLERSESIRHGILMTLDENGFEGKVVSENDEIIDEFSSTD